MRVDPWFDCKLPESAFALSVASPVENQISVFPNPAKDKLVIKSQKPGTFNLNDKPGRLQLSKFLVQVEAEIHPPTMISGLFICTMTHKADQTKPMLLQVE